MSALDPVTVTRLAELVMSAATELDDDTRAPSRPMAPTDIPVRRGRLHIDRSTVLFEPGDALTVVAGFASGVWIGAATSTPHAFGRLAYRTTATVDPRGRVVLDRRVRAWLGVADPVDSGVQRQLPPWRRRTVL